MPHSPGQVLVTWGSAWAGPKVHKESCQYAWDTPGHQPYGDWMDAKDVPASNQGGVVEDCKKCGGRS